MVIPACYCCYEGDFDVCLLCVDVPDVWYVHEIDIREGGSEEAMRLSVPKPAWQEPFMKHVAGDASTHGATRVLFAIRHHFDVCLVRHFIEPSIGLIRRRDIVCPRIRDSRKLDLVPLLGLLHRSSCSCDTCTDHNRQLLSHVLLT